MHFKPSSVRVATARPSSGGGVPQCPATNQLASEENLLQKAGRSICPAAMSKSLSTWPKYQCHPNVAEVMSLLGYVVTDGDTSLQIRCASLMLLVIPPPSPASCQDEPGNPIICSVLCIVLSMDAEATSESSSALSLQLLLKSIPSIEVTSLLHLIQSSKCLHSLFFFDRMTVSNSIPIPEITPVFSSCFFPPLSPF